ncbi:copper chaperone CopZ [Oceanobacillus chungangensis]|uniref:Copper chaperone CopZ n=1 Tax=Oceanobacillus chungangensis TaxID=1229152 RepID=A0A3D8PV30_9BACI|nr:copper chaperone CopZ [Oceanobacillus chungangensis]RDW19417.1 copper-binding protein [Oceanobacillus chungangensis]
MKTRLAVKGMTCGHCKMSVEGVLNELTGVKSAEVDLTTGNVEVTYDQAEVTLDKMREAVEEQGYDVVAS